MSINRIRVMSDLGEQRAVGENSWRGWRIRIHRQNPERERRIENMSRGCRIPESELPNWVRVHHEWLMSINRIRVMSDLGEQRAVGENSWRGWRIRIHRQNPERERRIENMSRGCRIPESELPNWVRVHHEWLSLFLLSLLHLLCCLRAAHARAGRSAPCARCSGSALGPSMMIRLPLRNT